MYIPVKIDCDLKEKIFNTLANKDRKSKRISKPIYCNLLIIDNFYNNPIDTRNYF